MKAPVIPAPPPLWRESRMGLEVARLLRHPIYRETAVERGDGHPVLLVPGFLAGDDSLGLMTHWLRRAGYHTRRAGIRMNVGCSGEAVDRLEERAEILAGTRGERITVIGQSRGGLFARALAARRPDLLSGIVTLGSPHRDALALHPLVRAQIVALGAIGTLGARGFLRRSCLAGDCCASFRDEVESPFPDRIGFVSIYSRTDGIVDWRSCLDPAAVEMEVRASHIGMGVNVGTYRRVAEILPMYRDAARERRTRRTRRPQPVAAERRAA